MLYLCAQHSGVVDRISFGFDGRVIVNQQCARSCCWMWMISWSTCVNWPTGGRCHVKACIKCWIKVRLQFCSGWVSTDRQVEFERQRRWPLHYIWSELITWLSILQVYYFVVGSIWLYYITWCITARQLVVLCNLIVCCIAFVWV